MLRPIFRALSFAAFCATLALPQTTALDRYVQKPDSNYKYEVVRTIPGQNHTVYVVNLTSQQWRTPAEVDHSIWKHWLTIVKPNDVRSSIGFLMIAGGSVTANAPERADASLVELATSTHTVAAALSGVPNEPVTFAGEQQSRNEDGIIAYSWVKYMQTGDETWPLRLPMTKAAVRAMDTVTALLAQPDNGALKVDRFYVAGGSKRGWTTWTTAAVDKRVIGVSPLVIDVLNVRKSLDHHFRAYGEFAESLNDYKVSRLTEAADNKEYAALMAIEDPYSYRARFTMPKFIVNSAGDQYFLPDSSQFYFDDLPGEKYLRYVPNTDHSLRNSDAFQSIAAFYKAVEEGKPRPRFSWTFAKDGSIQVNCIDMPIEVKVWSATNPAKRDFRLATLGPAYKSTTLIGQGKTYTARVENPAKGWTAFFVELTYPDGMKFTTAVRITPDTLEFPAPPMKAKVSDLR